MRRRSAAMNRGDLRAAHSAKWARSSFSDRYCPATRRGAPQCQLSLGCVPGCAPCTPSQPLGCGPKAPTWRPLKRWREQGATGKCYQVERTLVCCHAIHEGAPLPACKHTTAPSRSACLEHVHVVPVPRASKAGKPNGLIQVLQDRGCKDGGAMQGAQACWSS